MHLFLFQHREYSGLVYKAEAGVEVKVEVPKGKKDKNELLPEVEFDPNKTTHDEVWGFIDEKYGKTPYEALITSYVDSIMTTGPQGYKEDLIKGSTQRYMKFYRETKVNFMTEAEELKEKFDDAVEDIKDKVSDQLKVLKSAVEGAKKQVEFKEATPAPENEKAVEAHFKGYLKALNARYFNADVNFGTNVPNVPIPIIGAVIPGNLKGAAYRNKADAFQDKMSDWVEAKLDWMLKNKKTTKQDLDDFKKEIETRYQFYAGIDKNSAIISGVDLIALDKAAHPPLDAIGRILDASDEDAIKRLEIIQLMNPDGWEETVDAARKVIIKGVINNHSEGKFMTMMKQYGEVKDFEDAADLFEDKLEELGKADVRATLEFIRQFNQEVHSEVLQYEASVEPPALAMQVHKQMDYLLSGVLVPQKQEDKAIVNFMRADKEDRDAILNNPGTRAVLFRAIKMATELYPEIYEKQFANIPDDVTKLRRSRRIEKPTYHDRAAQLQALIILGKQAKVIVTKFEQTPDHKGKGYSEEMEKAQVPDEAKVVKTGVGFHAPTGGKATAYVSGIARGGFNTRDLALKGVKVFGALTVIANVAQSWSETSGELPDRILDTVEKSVTNQGVLIGAAATAGAHMAERNKAFLRYPWLSQHERAGAWAAFKLDNLGRRLGHDEVKRFVNNNAEWRALKDPAMDPSQIKEMLKTAGKRVRKGEKPVITIRDLRQVIKDESILSTLTKGGRSARMRYLFYQKFFASSSKPDVNHVKELCTGSPYIADSPVSQK